MLNEMERRLIFACYVPQIFSVYDVGRSNRMNRRKGYQHCILALSDWGLSIQHTEGATGFFDFSHDICLPQVSFVFWWYVLDYGVPLR